MTTIGRNAPCPCGSGRKYKHCCAKQESASASIPALPPGAIGGHAWQADIFPFPVAFEDKPQGRPSAVMVTANELVLETEVLTAPLGEVADIAARIARAIEAAQRRIGVVPRDVAVRWEEIAVALRGRLSAETRIHVDPALDGLVVTARELLTRVADCPYWPTVSLPDSWLAWGLPRPVIAELFEAAAAFHRAEPWRWLEGVPPLEATLADDREWTIAIMGSGGQEFGLTMYADIDDYLHAISADDPAETAGEFRDRTIALGFGKLGNLPRRIQREVASSGWRVAAPHAYPILMPVNTPAGGMSRADAADLIALLRAIPVFVAEHETALQSDDTIEWTHRETGAELRFDPLPFFGWLEMENPIPIELPPARRRRRATSTSRQRRGATAPLRPPRSAPAAAGDVLASASAVVEAYPRRDPAATAAVIAEATDLLRGFAGRHIEELSRVRKPEVWAAGALHAAFQVASDVPRTAAILADAFGASTSAVIARSRWLLESAAGEGAERPAVTRAPARRDVTDRETLSLWPAAEPPENPTDEDTNGRSRSNPSPSREPEAPAGPTAAELAIPPTGPRIVRESPRARRTVANAPKREKSGPAFTALQGQYLAFIHNYTKLHRRPPAETDMQSYFGVTPPSIHNMVMTLERKGLISRVPRQPRSIRVLVPREEIPDLD